jgi:hypothetical protein
LYKAHRCAFLDIGREMTRFASCIKAFRFFVGKRLNHTFIINNMFMFVKCSM